MSDNKMYELADPKGICQDCRDSKSECIAIGPNADFVSVYCQHTRVGAWLIHADDGIEVQKEATHWNYIEHVSLEDFKSLLGLPSRVLRGEISQKEADEEGKRIINRLGPEGKMHR